MFVSLSNLKIRKLCPLFHAIYYRDYFVFNGRVYIDLLSLLPGKIYILDVVLFVFLQKQASLEFSPGTRPHEILGKANIRKNSAVLNLPQG